MKKIFILIIVASFFLTGLSAKENYLFFTKKELHDLQNNARNSHRQIWNEFSVYTNSLTKRTPYPYKKDMGEQLWQRAVGDAIANMAIAGIVSEDPMYFQVASKWAEVSCSYPTWGMKRDSTDLLFGISGGHQMLGLAMLYDSGEKHLSSHTYDLIRETLHRRGAVAYNAFKEQKHGYLQNHTWIITSGLFAAALVLKDTYPECEAWIELAKDVMQKTTSMLPEDGASQEGVGYWTYGMQYLLVCLDLSKHNLGIDYYQNISWWKNTSSYCAYLMIPRASWSLESRIINLADCQRYVYNGPEHLFRKFAGLNNDPVAQWYGKETAKGKPETSWHNLIWYDSSVKTEKPDKLSTFKHFDNLGIVSARSNWSGKESMVVFKCGAPMGKSYYNLDTTLISIKDVGHVHPDANHFVIYANGEYLIKNNGYIKRQTRFHTTLLIDNLGQWGEKRGYFNPTPYDANRNPVIVEAKTSPEVDYITGDASKAYFDESGLKKFTRRLVYLKQENALVVIDDIEVSDPKSLTLYFYPENNLEQTETHVFEGKSKRNKFRIENLTPESAENELTVMDLEARSGNKKVETQLLKLTSRKLSQKQVTAFSWSEPKNEPARIQWNSSSNSLIVNGKTISL